MINILIDVIMKIAWAGRFLTLSSWLAPKCCETIEEIALRVWPNTQINIEIKAPTIPTAANDSVAFKFILPTMAVSVIERIGSDTPEINAGIASLFICFRLMLVFKLWVRNSKKDVRFVLGNKYFLIFYNHEVRKIFGFEGFGRKYLI